MLIYLSILLIIILKDSIKYINKTHIKLPKKL